MTFTCLNIFLQRELYAAGHLPTRVTLRGGHPAEGLRHDQTSQ